MGSVTKNVGRQPNWQINDIAATLAARIWVQGGKVMGFVAIIIIIIIVVTTRPIMLPP